ncbi:hypothetical protein UFOVP964_146 [uncultured Caudovirales phage]|uniref:Uncharacterized protein n=1 Tax=uncultured Caudovirales phage TaxID=2100421 RepID=A0A6J5QCQ4_9CAUD|nr:hypothetical protein UFOVP854_146 [uncultured Caudovirales phage]CAB4175296.1 hypothetical protein UFOVP964_146 [uncultured Caudovirales phage]CAB4178885.1 hypothetical protein UFOVP1034_12 [uncultured Caudovirales phage]CAB4189056.1 hypothetical protein UFOVP1177_12 [uncultured Caudovirales phage]CAB4193777.1 hypothetical protein UFOVP1243_155 [uncultured Caudovirales phage]
MPKVHNIGPKYFVQLIPLPVIWGKKVMVRGWTQEIEEPYRTSAPLLVRLPKFKALAFGKWTGFKSEEDALNSALETREVTYDDFTEEAGWTPAPDSDREESSETLYSRFDSLDGTINVHDWQTYYSLAKESE